MTRSLALVVLSPLSPELPVAFGVVALHALSPKSLARLVPLFGCAPVVGTIITLVLAGGVTPSPYFFAGLIAVAVGAVTVLVFAPKPHPHAVPAGAR